MIKEREVNNLPYNLSRKRKTKSPDMSVNPRTSLGKYQHAKATKTHPVGATDAEVAVNKFWFCYPKKQNEKRFARKISLVPFLESPKRQVVWTTAGIKFLLCNWEFTVSHRSHGRTRAVNEDAKPHFLFVSLVVDTAGAK